MPNSYLYIAAASAIALVTLVVVELLFPHRRRVLSIAVVASLILMIVIVETRSLSPGVETKGEPSTIQWIMIALMYGAMALGIVAQSYYFSTDQAQAGLGAWVKPALASPIVFIPLLSSYQNVLSALNAISIPEVMILLVSFQNGFFWKVIFDKQAEAMAKRVSTS